jgi:hypothetical protein
MPYGAIDSGAHRDLPRFLLHAADSSAARLYDATEKVLATTVRAGASTALSFGRRNAIFTT